MEKIYSVGTKKMKVVENLTGIISIYLTLNLEKIFFAPSKKFSRVKFFPGTLFFSAKRPNIAKNNKAKKNWSRNFFDRNRFRIFQNVL